MKTNSGESLKSLKDLCAPGVEASSAKPVITHGETESDMRRAFKLPLQFPLCIYVTAYSSGMLEHFWVIMELNFIEKNKYLVI